MISKSSDKRFAARWGVASAAIVTIGSTLANMYEASARAADGAGGWADLAWQDWLNVSSNAALALGCEGLGFLALGFIIAFARSKHWANFAAASAVFCVSIFVNGSNSHDFVMRQERAAAVEVIQRTHLWRQARSDEESAHREISKTQGPISPIALREQLERLLQDREIALSEGRRGDAKLLRQELRQAREDLVASVTSTERLTALRQKLEAAQAKTMRLEQNARAPADASRRAWTVLIAVEVIKALGMSSFGVDSLKSPVRASPTTPANRAALAPANPKNKISIDERRARQRRYTAIWRARKKETVLA